MKVAIFDVTRHINPTPHNVCLPVDPIDEMCLDASIKNLEIQQYHPHSAGGNGGFEE